MKGMRKIRRIAVVLFLLCALTAAAAAVTEWKVLKGTHFIVYYVDGHAFAGKVLGRAERYYKKIASDLGYSRYDNFWQWENRVRIYIYPTHEEFISATGIPREWAQGVAYYKEKKIVSYKWSKGFLDSLLPHEITHLIFRDFVGLGGRIPLWLDEGVAQWEEKSKKKQALKISGGLIKSGRYIPIGELMRMDVRQVEDPKLARDFYAQSVTLVGCLMEKYGSMKFTAFCRRLRDGESLEEALSGAYKGLISNVHGLEEKWIEYCLGG